MTEMDRRPGVNLWQTVYYELREEFDHNNTSTKARTAERLSSEERMKVIIYVSSGGIETNEPSFV